MTWSPKFVRWLQPSGGEGAEVPPDPGLTNVPLICCTQMCSHVLCLLPHVFYLSDSKFLQQAKRLPIFLLSLPPGYSSPCSLALRINGFSHPSGFGLNSISSAPPFITAMSKLVLIDSPIITNRSHLLPHTTCCSVYLYVLTCWLPFLLTVSLTKAAIVSVCIHSWDLFCLARLSINVCWISEWSFQHHVASTVAAVWICAGGPGKTDT